MAFSVSAFGLSNNRLPRGWTADRLDTLASFNPEQIGAGYPHSEIAYLDIGNVTAGVAGKPAMFPLSDAPSRAQRIARPQDTILSTVRPGNRAYAFLRHVPDNLIVSTGFAVLRAKDGTADSRFLYYLATSDPIIDYLASIAEEKTAYPSVNPGDIAECVVPIPPIEEQHAIARILGTLDDKIELNRRMNETLEAIAKAIFKSWFVDATQDGIPTDWREGKTAELATLSRDTINPGNFAEETFYHYSIPAFDEGRLPKAEAGEQIKSNKILVVPNTIMISKLNPRIPRVWLPTVDKSQRSVASTEFLMAIPRTGTSREYLYGLFNSGAFQEVFSTLVTGTSGSHQRVKPEFLLAMDIMIPSTATIERYTKATKPLHERVAISLEESRTLAAIRDALLPKLLSGEIRVKDAEKFVGGAV